MKEMFDCIYNGETGEIYLEDILKAEAYIRTIKNGFRVVREETWDDMPEDHRSCYDEEQKDMCDLVVVPDVQKEQMEW